MNLTHTNMISVPCAVYINPFHWQLDLFWYNHKKVYGNNAYDKAHAIVIKRNVPTQPKVEEYTWEADIPHTMCESFFDYTDTRFEPILSPVNIQIGLKQIINKFDDEQILEVLDCDMFHMKPVPEFTISDDEFLVCDLYEPWHLKSLTEHRQVVEPFLRINEPIFYNGGFVPIIGKVKTFKKILDMWIDIHIEIVKKYPDNKHFRWWAGMYALQVVCQNNGIKMTAFNKCYIPYGDKPMDPEHYISHYSVDYVFSKKIFPQVNTNRFPDNLFYNSVKEWVDKQKIVSILNT